jgi:hypothetical protein
VSSNSKAKSKSQVSEFVELVIGYLKQETLGPISRLGRYVIFGFAGSLMLSAGVVLLVIGVLRLLQSETGSTFSGHLSWLPYVIAAVLGVLVVGLGAVGIVKKRDTRSL